MTRSLPTSILRAYEWIELAMNKRADDVLMQKIRQLPPERQAEVENFVNFLASQEQRRDAARVLAAVRERLTSNPLPPMSAEDIQAEIEAYRIEQRRAAGT